jgi:glycosyltransferase involved in cell wall biosynthesis
MAYVLLWFPKPSETFIFREVVNLWRAGAPIKVFSLYGEWREYLSPEMAAVAARVQRLGRPWLRAAPADLTYWRRRKPDIVSGLFREIPLRRWRSIEVGGENLWAFFCGFTLARRFEEQGIGHIHAPWANGPATAAWVASRLTGIPFSFMGRAVDIFPPDGALAEKIRDCAFVRTNPRVNVPYLESQCPEAAGKVFLSYDGCPLESVRQAPVPMTPPYRILALGRFARIKGFEYLMRAAHIMDRAGLDFRLTLAGSGFTKGLELRLLRARFGLRGRVSFPGFLRHDQVSDFLASGDVFVMPSIVHRTGERDGIPNVIVEALAHRLPVVATDVAGIGEVVRDGETGRLVPQRDPAALAQAITDVVADRDAAVRMAERGRALVGERFDPGRCCAETLALFESLCGPQSGNPAPSRACTGA